MGFDFKGLFAFLIGIGIVIGISLAVLASFLF